MSEQVPVVRDVSAIPAISADAYQHVGRYAGAIVMSVFEQIGGVHRMASWADSNPTDYFTKIFTKMIARSTQVDVSGSVTIDDAITRLERGTDPVEAQFEEVREYDL